jgi:hypothetical protein
LLVIDIRLCCPLVAETKTIIAAYERCLATGDTAGVATLRRAIGRRIDDLEAFYLANVEDERSVLFEKQRLRLRKLLAEYDGIAPGDVGAMSRVAGPEVVAAAAGSAGSRSVAPPPVPSQSQQQYYQQHQYFQQQMQQAQQQYQQQQAALAPMPALAVTKEIREDTRLNGQELLAWFTQAGAAEMPEVPAEAIARVFASVTRTNSDGKMSVRDLRQWYITFGKRAAKEGILLGTNNSGAVQAILAGANPSMAGSSVADPSLSGVPGLGQDEIVSVAFVKAVGAAAVTARKEAALHEKKRGVVDMLASGSLPPASSSSSGSAGGMGSSGLLNASGMSTGGQSSRRPIYAWETGADGRSGSPSRGGASSSSAAEPLTLPNGILEFQVRLVINQLKVARLANTCIHSFRSSLYLSLYISTLCRSA